MKKNRLMNILAASLIISSVAASVNAADYAVKPEYSLPVVKPSTVVPSIVTTVTPAPQKKPQVLTPMEQQFGVSFENKLNVIEDSNVISAIENNQAIAASYKSAVVKASAVAALGNSIDSELRVVTKRYVVEIASDTVFEAKDINLSMSISKDSSKRALVIRTAQKDSFGCVVKMIIPKSIYKQSNLDEEESVIYRINPTTGKAVRITDIQYDSDGNIVFDMYEGGSYIIL